MGNFLLRKCRWQKNTQEIPLEPRIQNSKRKTSRKKAHLSKGKQNSLEKNEDMSAVSIQQDSADEASAEELCYTLINHTDAGRKPLVNNAEEHYENISPQAERPRNPLRGTETEYSLLRVPSTPMPSTSKHPPSLEDEYEFLMPSPSYSEFQQSCPSLSFSET